MPAEGKTDFSERVFERMMERGWNQAMLATMAKMQPATLSRLLNLNKVQLHDRHPKTFQKIADSLGVTVGWLLTGKEPKLQILSPQACPEADLVVMRIRVAVEVWAEYLEQNGYRLPPKMLADAVCKLYKNSVKAGMHEKEDLIQLMNTLTE